MTHMIVRRKRKERTQDNVNKRIKLMNVVKKQDDDSEDEEQQDEPYMTEQMDTIYRKQNHIYFRREITIETISKMIKLIEEANNEFEAIEASVRHIKMTPQPIYLHITSPGGLLFAGFMGMDAIENSRVPIYTVVEGMAASAGTILSLAGKRRFMMKNAYYLIHQLSSSASGTYRELNDDKNNNDELMDKLKKLYTDKTNGKLKNKKLDEYLGHDIYWNYETCKNFGLIEGEYRTEQIRTVFD